MNEKIDELKIRIQNLRERENELQDKISSLNSYERSTMSQEEIKKLDEYINEYNAIEKSKDEVIVPKCELLDMYIEANEYIEKLSNEGLNKSVKTKLINKLEVVLLHIKERDEVLAYTDEDVNVLYEQRNNSAVFNEQLKMFDTVVDGSIDILINEINSELDKLEKSNSKTKSSNNKIGKIIGSVVLVAAILLGVRACSKKQDKENDTRIHVEDNTLELIPTMDPIVVETPNPTLAPTPMPVPVQNDVPTIDVDDKAMDIETRAKAVAETNFFEDLYPSDIAGILNAIHEGQMWSEQNAGYAQAFNTTFNRIFEHYVLGTLTTDDVNKLDALKYLAKDNSDLDRFLERYADLLKEIISNPNNKEANNKMVEYINIFATSLNGFTNEPDALTNDNEFNENAQVNDFFNWWFAYDSIIKPTYPLLYQQELYEIDGAIIEKIMYETYSLTEEERKAYIENLGLANYEAAIINQIKLYELQYTMESALVNHPQFCEIRHVSELTLERGN